MVAGHRPRLLRWKTSPPKCKRPPNPRVPAACPDQASIPTKAVASAACAKLRYEIRVCRTGKTSQAQQSKIATANRASHWSVALLAGSGALNTWFMTNGLRNFLGTEYGDLVLIKIVLFVVLLSFGAANRYWFTPQLLPIGATTGENSRSLRLLCASVVIEITLGLVVICVVAVLGQLPPPGHEHHMD